MQEALTPTGEVLTLTGSKWYGQQLTREEAQALSGELHCVCPGCTVPVIYRSDRGFCHEDWKTGCWLSKHHVSSNAHTGVWIERQLIGEHNYRPAGVASARVVQVRGGSPVAVRDLGVRAAPRKAPWKELRSAEKNRMTSLWLVNDILLPNGELCGLWCQGFLRMALAAKLWPVSMGLVDDKKRTIRFVGDLQIKVQDEREEIIVATVSDLVPAEAFMWWTRNGGKTPLPEYADGVRVIEQMTQRRIQLVA